jgi:hypothetical protein
MKENKISKLLNITPELLPASSYKWKISKVINISLKKRYLQKFNDYTNYTTKFHKRLY